MSGNCQKHQHIQLTEVGDVRVTRTPDACPYCRISALEAEQVEFRKDRKELNERYDEMTHKYELRVQALEAENERLKESEQVKCVAGDSVGYQIESLMQDIMVLRGCLGEAVPSGTPDLLSDGTQPSNYLAGYLKKELDIAKAAGKREAAESCKEIVEDIKECWVDGDGDDSRGITRECDNIIAAITAKYLTKEGE